MLLAAFVVGLVLVPVVWRASSKAPGPAGADRASPAPAGPGYSFLRVNRSGTPVRWDPCTPITYQLDLAGAPAWAQDDILGAITAVSDATGIQFAPDGTTNQFPASDVPPGTASATPPVVIAWASGPQSAQLGLAAGDPSGVDADHLGRTVPVASYDQTSGRMVYITGSVVLGAAAGRLPGGFGPGGDGLLVLHQLGRLLGLGDVPDPSEVMDPAVLTTGVTALGAGDRAGLHRLGRASGCVSPPAGGVLQPVL